MKYLRRLPRLQAILRSEAMRASQYPHLTEEGQEKELRAVRKAVTGSEFLTNEATPEEAEAFWSRIAAGKRRQQEEQEAPE